MSCGKVALTIGLGAILGLGYLANQGYQSRVEACSNLEPARLYAQTITTDNHRLHLDDVQRDVLSYRLPLYLDSIEKKLYDLTTCP